ncbi:hypothetical protein FHW67_002183 [Herbaspirillum sp. Sphag1AN]|uniref:hypothetical protein n=1 Tax=unclassified Herbaspirillum TaxID=2624150 RepID=UPI001610B66D|nr:MULTISPECIES: hypothetical protein [unclassified Herbaspirillum]MBB3212895.1 hypothetical protein [Herbaspirillum sp. Sphag1AN]MBB3246092.1 hypothetical protein [Herbaspirillum sp. Sphag64]
MSASLPLLDSNALCALAKRSAAVTASCDCTQAVTAGWVSTPLSFPEHLLQDIGTLLADPYDEPSFKEYHPAGTRYESPEAPIAPQHFPYNRCQVAVCTHCGRHYLRYTEAGGYFVDRRLRALYRADLVVDA